MNTEETQIPEQQGEQVLMVIWSTDVYSATLLKNNGKYWIPENWSRHKGSDELKKAIQSYKAQYGILDYQIIHK